MEGKNQGVRIFSFLEKFAYALNDPMVNFIII